MKYLRHLVVFHVFFLGFASFGSANWSSRNRLEVGMTDNALRSDADKESDIFFAAGTSNRFNDVPGHALGLRLRYQDYNKESANDLLSWGLSDEIKCLSDKVCEFELRGQDYVYGEPATTDYSFTNYGVAVAITKNRELKNSISLDLTGGYEARNFSSLNRLDNSVYFKASVGQDTTSQLYLEGNGEAGLVLSSSAEYSVFYFEISGLSEYTLDKFWDVTGELSVKQTSFLNRDLTTETQVTRKSGKVVSQFDTSKEAYSAIYFSVEANRSFAPGSSAALGVRTFQQRSRSGYQDYKENELLAKWLITF